MSLGLLEAPEKTRPSHGDNQRALASTPDTAPFASQSLALLVGFAALAFAGMGLALVRQARPQRISRPMP